jgi:predicted TIM-barrel fold metal-dependent hydrolase
MKRIAIEEHFHTRAYVEYMRSRTDFPRTVPSKDQEGKHLELVYCASDYYLPRKPEITNRLLDFADIRLKEMDDAGIDMQVLSLVCPGPEVFDGPTGTRLARETNDELFEVIKRYPQRFAGFAAVAPQEPRGAALELERAVRELGLRAQNKLPCERRISRRGEVLAHPRDG